MLEIIPDKPYVYKLSYPNGIVFYIGKGTNNRIHKHEWEASWEDEKAYNLRKSRVIRKIWKEGGQVVKEIIAYFDTDKEAHAYEIALIFFMRPYGYLTNITDGGEGKFGMKPSEQTIKKMSEAQKGRKHSEETRKKIGEKHKGNQHNLGNNHSEETRNKISLANKGGTGRKGYNHSKETKQRIAKGNTGKIISEDTRKKLIESHRGIGHSEETKLKMSKTRKGKPSGIKGKKFSEESKKKLSEIMRMRWAKRKELSSYEQTGTD